MQARCWSDQWPADSNLPGCSPVSTITTDHMETRTSPFVLAAVVALFTGIVSPARAAGPPSAPPFAEDVELTGWLHVEDFDFDDATVLLVLNGEVRSVPISKTGRIELSLPVGTEAVLRFEHPGHLTKEVTVDTHHARDGHLGRDVRHVRFAVILEETRLMAGMDYAGPVANLGFDKEGGCLAIEHTRTLVVGRSRNKPMVF